MARLQRRRLNNRTVADLKSDRETLVWDQHLPGFAVRVYPSGTCTYVVQTRGPYGARRVTLGRHGVIGATEARRRAWQVIARIKAGQEPLPSFFERLCGNYDCWFGEFRHTIDVEGQRAASRFVVRLPPQPAGLYADHPVPQLLNSNFFEFAGGRTPFMMINYSTAPAPDTPTVYPRV